MTVGEELRSTGLIMAVRAVHVGDLVGATHVLLSHTAELAECFATICVDGRNAEQALLRVSDGMLALGREFTR